jgi:hypothetical protein
MTDFQGGAGRIKTCTKYGGFMGFHRDFIRISNGFHRDMYLYIYTEYIHALLSTLGAGIDTSIGEFTARSWE